MKKLLSFSAVFLLSLGLLACSKKEDPHVIRVGTIAGPETQLIEAAVPYAKKHFGLTIQTVTFTDYNMPNIALNDGSIDANVFQHLPYLDAFTKARGYPLVSIGKTFIYPMGLYSKKVKDLSQLKKGDVVAIPNDPSNEARALLLLQSAKLITLKPGITITATPADIAKNPKQLLFKELDAAQIPRALPDVSLAAINTTYAIPAGLFPTKDALFTEKKSSPYANIIVVKKTNVNKPKMRDLVKSLHSKPVKDAAAKLFKSQAIQAW